MAKNKRAASDFDRFKPPDSATEVEDDDADIQEPTDTVDPEEVGKNPPNNKPLRWEDLTAEERSKLTAAEQEEILAKMQAPAGNFPDPANQYYRTLTSAKQVPVYEFPDSVDPLLVECYTMFENVMAGGLLMQSAYHIHVQVRELLDRIRKGRATKKEQSVC